MTMDQSKAMSDYIYRDKTTIMPDIFMLDGGKFAIVFSHGIIY